MIKKSFAAIKDRRFRAVVALLSILSLTACQHEVVTADKSVKVTNQVMADSTNDDPPVGPGGPGTGH